MKTLAWVGRVRSVVGGFESSPVTRLQMEALIVSGLLEMWLKLAGIYLKCIRKFSI